MTVSRSAFLIALPITLAIVAGCTQVTNCGSHSDLRPPLPPEEDIAPDPALIPAFHRITPWIASGGTPLGVEGYRELERVGFRVVVSVDGARPQIEAARETSLTALHMPIGYDQVPPEVTATLAKLASFPPAPIYIHCHHGLHRGPAAAAVFALAIGAIDRAEALAILTRAGTSLEYRGLWRSVEEFVELDPEVESLPLTAVAEVRDLTHAMILVDRAFERLQLLCDHSWQTPASHPDLDATQESTLLREGFTEAVRALPDDTPLELRAELIESEKAARALEATQDATERLLRFSEIGRACRTCHIEYRN